MSRIVVKCKVSKTVNSDNYFIKLPTIKRHHCEIETFRNNPNYSGIINSELFEIAVRREVNKLLKGAKLLRTDLLPECVTIKEMKFISEVTINID